MTAPLLIAATVPSGRFVSPTAPVAGELVEVARLPLGRVGLQRVGRDRAPDLGVRRRVLVRRRVRVVGRRVTVLDAVAHGVALPVGARDDVALVVGRAGVPGAALGAFGAV